MSTPYEWHQAQLARADSLDAELMPAAMAGKGAEFMTTYFLVIADGLRSLIALTRSADSMVILDNSRHN